jgi:hypothetical protein
VASSNLFAPLPLRAMKDDLSGLELKVLTCVAAHDRMSLITGKGQGCRASNERMSSMVGCNYARLCSTLTKLTKRGYLKQEKLGRHTVYRVIYTDEDRLLFSNVSGSRRRCDRLPDKGATSCQHTSETAVNPPKTASQYIPLNGVRYSVETGEDSSSEAARFDARRLGRTEFSENVGGELARLEREINAGCRIDDAWSDFLDVAIEHENQSIRQWAFRLSELL